VAALFALNTVPAFAQSTTFSSTDLRNPRHQQQSRGNHDVRVCPRHLFRHLRRFAIRRGDVDQGKMSIIGGAIIAAAPAGGYAFYKIFGPMRTARLASAISNP